MSNYYNDQWRLPNNENKDKQSNYSIDKFDLNDYISTPLTIDEFSSATMSIWFKTSLSQNDKYFLTFPEASGANGFDLNFVTSGIKSYLQCHSGSNSLTSSFTYNDGNWHHVIVSYSGTNHKMYIDGVLTASASASIGTIKNAEGNLYIGGLSSLYPAYRVSQTKLDQVAVFDYALSDGGVSVGQTATGQIATLYGGGSAIGNPMSLSPAPVAYYPLGDQDAFNGADYLVPNSSLKDYVFDFGGSSYIDLGDSNDFSFGNGTADSPFSVSFWAKLNSVSGTQPFLSKDTGSPNREWAISIFSDSSSGVRIFLKNQGGDSQQSIDSSTSLITGVWYHITTTYDGRGGSDAADGLNIYINGILDTPTNQSYGTYTAMSNTTSPVYIGKYSSNLIDGIMSNHQIFNTALPATGSNSVETLYNNGSPLTSMSGFTSLQGWWKLDASATYDGTDWTIPDDSSNSNDGTSSGMTQANLVQSDLSFTSGYSPYALDFDGTNDYINIPNSTDFNLGTSFTISGWFNVTSYVSNMGYISFDSGSTRGWFLFHQSTNLALYDGTSVTTLNSNLQPTNEWNSYIITYDGTDLIFYLNGQQNSTQAVSVNLQTNGNNGQIGNQQFASGRFYNGSISNVSVWDTNLSSSQVTEIYSEGVPSNLNNHSAYSNLVSWWQLGSNTSWVDPYWISLDEKGTNNGESQNVAAPNNMGENAIVDGVGSYANGLSSGMGGDEVIGDAPYSSSNSLSVNMDVEDRTTDTPS